MGLFSSKTIVTVSTVANRVIEDKHLPNSLRTGVINGIFSDNGEQLVENIMEEVSGSIAIKADRMYRYGKEKYLYGLPANTLLKSNSGEEVIRALLSEKEGRPVTIDYYHYAPLNNLHYGWQYLVQNYGYDQYTNELTSLSGAKGFPVYLNDLQVVVVEATVEELARGALDQWGTAATAGFTPLRPASLAAISGGIPTPFGVDATAQADYFRMSIIWEEVKVTTVGTTTVTTRSIKTEDLQFPMGDMDPLKDYFQVKYSFGDKSDGSTQETSGTEQLAEFLNVAALGSVGPVDKNIRYFTYASGSGTYEELDKLFSPEYDDLGSFYPFGYFRFNGWPTSTDPRTDEYKHSRKLMKYLGMDYAAAAEAINSNPDIKDVESALLMMVVPADTGNPVEQKYLFDFFKRLYYKTGGVGVPQTNTLNIISTQLGLNEAPPLISLVIQDKRFKSALSMSNIYRRTRSGSIGKIGTYASGIDKGTVTKNGIKYESETDLTGVPYTWEELVTFRYYRKQTTATLYEEIQVYNLEMTFYVWDGYAASLPMVPLDHSITQHYFSGDREELYARSLHYIFNSKQVTKLKWYQTGLFKALITIVGIAITIFSMGADGGAGITAAIAAATASVEAFLITIIVTGLKMLIAHFAIKLFVKVLGVQGALIFAALLAVAAGIDAFASNSLAGAPWANDLLNVASGLVKGASDAIGDALLGLKSQAEAFGLEVIQKTELLDNAKNLLEGNNLLSPFIIFGESPTDYYERTVHSGNIGAISLESVSSFVDVALTLPKLSETIGEIQ